MSESGADLGICFDGDADRAAFVDETGEPVGSDLSTALIAGEILEREPGAAIIYDLRSSRAVAEYIREHGGEPVRERVGHSFIKATLRRRDSPFGGELAGHYYFKDNFNADCSLMAIIEMLNLLWKSGRSMSVFWPLQVATIVLGLLIIVRHRGNIARLFRGEESKISDPANETPV